MFKKLLLGLALSLIIAFSAWANWQPKPHLQVEGNAKLELEADLVSFEANFAFSHKDSDLALQNLEQHLAPLLRQLNRELTANNQLAAGQINLQPKQQEINKQWQIVGYQASRSLKLQNLNLQQASTYLQLLSDYQPSNLGNMQYSSSQIANKRNELLATAVKDAQQKASTLAKGLNQNLGKALEISEITSPAFPVLRSQMYADAAPAAKQRFQLLPSQLEINAKVKVVFELK